MTWLVDYHTEYFAELSAEAEVLQDAVFSLATVEKNNVYFAQ